MSEVLARLHPQQLLRKGTVAAAGGDAAALLQAYARHGEALPKHVGGPFAPAALAPTREPRVAAIDRTGPASLYFAPIADGVAVATHAGLLLDHPGVDASLDTQPSTTTSTST